MVSFLISKTFAPDSIFGRSRWEKRGRGGTSNEVEGNHLMKSNGCKSRTAKASEQAGSECCHSSGDWWVRSVHSKEAGREGTGERRAERLF